LQHHAILRTTLTIFPPAKATSSPPRLLVDLKQVSYFTLRPQSEDLSTFVPEWYAGNIYDMERAVPHAVELPSVVSILKPTKFDLFVSGDYEASRSPSKAPNDTNSTSDQIIWGPTC